MDNWENEGGPPLPVMDERWRWWRLMQLWNPRSFRFEEGLC